MTDLSTAIGAHYEKQKEQIAEMREATKDDPDLAPPRDFDEAYQRAQDRTQREQRFRRDQRHGK